MIGLEYFSTQLQTLLNGASNATVDAFMGKHSGTWQVAENTKFVFSISPDTAERATAGRTVNENTVTYTIDGIMEQTSFDVSGTDENTFSAEITTATQILIPLVDSTNLRRSKAVTQCRALITSVLGQISKADVTDGDKSLTVISSHSLANTGIRAIRNDVGDSVIFTIFSTFNITYASLYSDDVTVKIKKSTEQDTSYITLKVPQSGFHRETVTQSNVAIGSGKAGNVVTGTALTISLTVAIKKTALMDLITDYVIGENVQTFTVQVIHPTTTATALTKTFTMIFKEVGENLATGMDASASIVLVEKLV